MAEDVARGRLLQSRSLKLQRRHGHDPRQSRPLRPSCRTQDDGLASAMETDKGAGDPFYLLRAAVRDGYALQVSKLGAGLAPHDGRRSTYLSVDRVSFQWHRNPRKSQRRTTHIRIVECCLLTRTRTVDVPSVFSR